MDNFHKSTAGTQCHLLSNQIFQHSQQLPQTAELGLAVGRCDFKPFKSTLGETVALDVPRKKSSFLL